MPLKKYFTNTGDDARYVLSVGVDGLAYSQ
jgi:hypothetical protein